MKLNITTLLKLSLAGMIGFSPITAMGQSKRSQDRSQERTQKLPQKTTPTKRTFLDFSKDDTTVISKPVSPLDRALNKSIGDVQVASPPTQVRSRRIVPAPQGDLAEPITAYAAKPAAPLREEVAKTTVPSVTKVATKSTPTPSQVLSVPTATPSRTVAKPTTLPEKSTPVATPAPVVVATPAPTPEVEVSEPIVADVRATENISKLSSAPAFEPFEEFAKPKEPTRSVVKPLAIVEAPAIQAAAPTTTLEPSMSATVAVESAPATTKAKASATTGEGFIRSIDEETMAFVRTGFYTANYKKFDDRMSNGASVLGIGVGRGAETSWGSFEARAAFDMYHAMDQSVTVDNIRMLSVRTELAYWLSRSRVKPGVSLGLGWADYSIRSYRSVSGANEEDITMRTHAKGRAFSIIPATSLRIELSKGLVVDVQTEFMALLGGSSPDAAQGLGVNVGLGWIF